MQIFTHTCKVAFAVALLGAAIVAQPAGAATAPPTCQAPPGTCAIDQYCEAIPNAGGTSGHHKKGSHSVSDSTIRQLKQQGAAGKAVLRLATSGGAAKHLAAEKRHHKRHSSGSSSVSAPPTATQARPVSHVLPAPNSNPLSAVGSAIGTGSSTGAVFLVLLGAVAVVMGGTAFIGYRRRAHES